MQDWSIRQTSQNNRFCYEEQETAISLVSLLTLLTASSQPRLENTQAVSQYQVRKVRTCVLGSSDFACPVFRWIQFPCFPLTAHAQLQYENHAIKIWNSRKFPVRGRFRCRVGVMTALWQHLYIHFDRTQHLYHMWSWPAASCRPANTAGSRSRYIWYIHISTELITNSSTTRSIRNRR